LREHAFGAVVLDPHGSDLPTEVLAEGLAGAAGRVPVIVTADHDLPAEAEAGLKKLAAVGTVRRAASPQRRLDQATPALHVPLPALAPDRRLAIERLHQSDAALAGKKVLVVDDDIRNIFALTSVLERQNMVVLSAESGRLAIDTLKREPSIDIVLM